MAQCIQYFKKTLLALSRQRCCYYANHFFSSLPSSWQLNDLMYMNLMYICFVRVCGDFCNEKKVFFRKIVRADILLKFCFNQLVSLFTQQKAQIKQTSKRRCIILFAFCIRETWRGGLLSSFYPRFQKRHGKPVPPQFDHWKQSPDLWSRLWLTPHLHGDPFLSLEWF